MQGKQVKITVESATAKQPYHGQGTNGPYTIRKWDVTQPDGNTVEVNTIDKTWEPVVGETYDCEDKTKNEKYPTFSPILPKSGGFGGKGKGFTPRDYAAEERAKHPSFALSYAKDITAAIIAAKGEQGGKTFDVEAFTLTLADKFLGWLTAHAPKSAPVQQDAKPTTPDGWIAAIQAAGLGQAVKDAKLQRADMEAWYAQNPAGFIERVKEAIEGSSLPF